MNVKPRSTWNARPPKRQPVPWSRPPAGVVVHWVGGAGSLHGRDPAVTIRSIQATQMAREYTDIAYNLLVDRDGGIWEGRGLAYRGAANGPATNATHVSVCVLDNQDDRPTRPSELAVFQIWQHVGGELRLHREVNQTTCPGPWWTAWVERTRTTPLPPVDGNTPDGLAETARRVRDTIGTGPVLRRGSRGRPVADWQFALVLGSAQHVIVDGIFGTETEAATARFQRFFHLTPDGIVGPRTRGAMALTLAAKVR